MGGALEAQSRIWVAIIMHTTLRGCVFGVSPFISLSPSLALYVVYVYIRRACQGMFIEVA